MTTMSRNNKTQSQKKKRINIRSAKTKGKKLQKWTCEQVAQATGFEWGSPGEDKPIESRAMGQAGCDIRLDESVRKIFPYSIECKSQEKWNIPGWIDQAKKNQVDGTNWLLFVKRNRHSPIVIMDAEEFFKLGINVIIVD